MDSFLSGGLTPAGREEVESHLSRCRRCRLRAVNLYADARESEETHRAPRGLKREALRIPVRGQSAWARRLFSARRYAAPALAAAALVIISVGGFAVWQARQDARRTPAGDSLRQEVGQAATPHLLSPGAGARVPSGEIEFSWTPVPRVREYTLVVLDEQGDLVTKRQTTQERIVLGDSSSGLARGKNYFWYVEAKLTDGTTAETGMSKFTPGGD